MDKRPALKEDLLVIVQQVNPNAHPITNVYQQPKKMIYVPQFWKINVTNLANSNIYVLMEHAEKMLLLAQVNQDVHHNIDFAQIKLVKN
jgi:hypothetical protein